MTGPSAECAGLKVAPERRAEKSRRNGARRGSPLKAPRDWWNGFFEGLAVDFWRAAVPPEATQADVEFLWKHLRLSPGARVLDVPCGAGRLSVPLAVRGAAVTGIDISPAFIDAAREAATEARVSATFSGGDMRELPSRAFDAVFCFGNSFGYLDDAGNEAFLEAVAASLVAGGRFALDFGQTAESVYPRLEARQEAEMAGFRFIEETRLDPVASRVENVFEFSKDGRSERKLASQRVYLVGDVVRMLARVGLETRDIFGSTDGEPFALSAQRLLLVAEKPPLKASAKPSASRVKSG
jgi:SAM-dependent methyltransferase